MQQEFACESSETARYIESMLLELRLMGQQIDADFLVYLIEMAMIEASDIAKGRMTPQRQLSSVVTRPDQMSSEQVANLYFEGAFD